MDYDICSFILLAGGPRLLHVLHQNSGLPSLSTAYRVVDRNDELKKMNMTLTTIEKIDKIVKTNINTIVAPKSQRDRDGSETKMWSIKVDEIAVKKRLRYRHNTNEIFGLCATHSTTDNVVFSNVQVADLLEKGIADDSLHFASESCIFSLSALGTTSYHAKPFLSFPLCNHDTFRQQKSTFEAVLTSWEDLDWESLESSKNFLINIGTDGESVRRAVLHSLRQSTVEPSSKLYNELGSLEFLDLSTAERDITFDFDGKHIGKRLRNNLINGSIEILGTKFDAANIKLILQTRGKLKEQEIYTLLNPIDKQNVPLAVKLLDALSEKPCSDSSNMSPGLCDMIPALNALAPICKGILSLFARPSLSIHESLGALSTMSHVLLFLFAQGDIKLPSVLYHDLQSTVQNAYFVAAKYKIHCPNKPLYLYQVGSDQLEQIFSCVRTQNHDRGCDVYQLECQMKNAVLLEKILNKHPEWRQKSKRLSGPVDHTNPSNWTGDLVCRDLLPAISWNWGKDQAKSSLPQDYEITVHEGSTALKPKGQYIGVTDSSVSEEEIAMVVGDNGNRANEALVEFEDEISEKNQPHEITVMQDGNEMYKSTVLRLISANKGFRK